MARSSLSYLTPRHRAAGELDLPELERGNVVSMSSRSRTRASTSRSAEQDLGDLSLGRGAGADEEQQEVEDAAGDAAGTSAGGDGDSSERVNPDAVKAAVVEALADPAVIRQIVAVVSSAGTTPEAPAVSDGECVLVAFIAVHDLARANDNIRLCSSWLQERPPWARCPLRVRSPHWGCPWRWRPLGVKTLLCQLELRQSLALQKMLAHSWPPARLLGAANQQRLLGVLQAFLWVMGSRSSRQN